MPCLRADYAMKASTSNQMRYQTRTTKMKKTTTEEKPLAIVCSDMHLSMKPPAARYEEPDWFEAMARPLHELEALRTQYSCPVLVSGDIFDRWNSPPELINFAFRELPREMYVIAGQHDLPYHAGADIHKSALGTLIEAGRVTLVPPEGILIGPKKDHTFLCYGFGWNVPVRLKDTAQEIPKVALHHAYRWDDQATAYKDASDENKINPEEYTGFDYVIIGDNHVMWEHNFLVEPQRTQRILNPGSLMRRHSNQAAHTPIAGILWRDKNTWLHKLDCSKDRFNATAEEPVSDSVVLDRMADFLKKTIELKTCTIDFVETMVRYMKDNKVSDEAQQIILEALDHAKK